MVDLGLYNFIKNALARGQTEAQIRDTLTKAGWAALLVDEAVAAAKEGKEPYVPHLNTDAPGTEHTEEVAGTVPGGEAKTWSQRLFPMFYGRIGVGGYWKAVLVEFLLLVTLWAVLSFAAVAFLQGGRVNGLWGAGAVVLSATALGMFFRGVFGFFGAGVIVRRLHDLGFSGWTLFIFFLLPAAGVAGTLLFGSSGIYVASLVAVAVLWLVLAFWPGSSQPNRYGSFTYYSLRASYFGNGGVGRSFGVAAVAGLASAVLFMLLGGAVVGALFPTAHEIIVPSIASTTAQVSAGSAPWW